jgi:hypothetical protein
VAIGYLEAWRTWLAGQQPSGDAVMWFMSIRWWGRAGKMAAFIGGATVILDLVGSARLKTIGRFSSEVWKESRSHVAGVTAAIVLCALPLGTFVIVAANLGRNEWADVSLIATAGLLGLGLWLVMPLLMNWLIDKVLNRERPAQVLRYIGLFLLFVGFHFDLLAS